MEIFNPSSFKRIYTGLFGNLICSVIRMAFFLLVTVFTVINGSGSVWYQLLNAILSVGSVATLLTAVAGLSDMISIRYMRRARMWLIIQILVYTLYVLVEGISFALSSRVADAMEAARIGAIIILAVNIFDVLAFLWFDSIFYWNLLLGLKEIAHRVGASLRYQQRTDSLRKQMAASCALVGATSAVAIIFLNFRDASLHAGAQLTVSTDQGGIVVVILAILMIAFFLWKYIVQASVVGAVRQIGNAVKELSL